MGAWGDLPWENDGAADFFGDLFPPDFHDKVATALRGDDPSEVRAAAWLVTQLAHSAYIWPGEPGNMGAICLLAAERLEWLAAASEEEDTDDWGDPADLRRAAAELRARRHRPLGL